MDQSTIRRAAFWLALALTVAGQFSIAACHILLGAALLALLVSRERPRLPPIWMPIAAIFAWTLISLAFSPDPRAGFPQIKKFYVFLILPAVYTAAARSVPALWRLVLVWGSVEAVQALYSIGQFGWKWEQAREKGEEFYRAYLGRRITGTFSHWMTLGGVEMIVLLMMAALVLFAPPPRRRVWAWIAVTLIGVSIALGGTRSIWLGSAAGCLYLVARWRPWLLATVPVLLAAALLFGPPFVRERFESIFRPHGTLDSNEHRVVTFRTGLEMVKAHPWLGLGPEMPGRQFRQYLPKDIPEPLPEGFYGHLHNIYLQYAAERGIPALLFLLWLLGWMIVAPARALRQACSAEVRALLHGTIATVLGIMIEGFAENNLGDSEVLGMFLAVVAVAWIAIDSIGDREAPAHV